MGRLERFEARPGLVGYRSPALASLGVPHVFTTRRGGLTEELDLGTLDAARAAALRALVPRDGVVVRVAQVHGARVHHVAGAPWPEPPPEGDALLTERRDRLLLVRVADCAPVLLASSDGRRVAAVHAGWRGLLAGVLPAAVTALGDEAPVAAIGPCLSLARFEVGPDVAALFRDAGLAAAVQDVPGRRPHVDLRETARLQLVAAGVTRLDTTDRCTWEHAEEFFSHRRDVTHGGRPRTGRMAAVIATATP